MKATDFLKKPSQLEEQNLFLIVGDEPYMADACLQALEDLFKVENEALNKNIFREKITAEGFKLACLQAPVFSPARLVYMEDVDIAEAGLKADDVLNMLPFETKLVLRYTKKPDMRKAVYKRANKEGAVIEADAPYGAAFITWIMNTAKKEGVTISKPLAELMVEISGSDMYTIKHEIDKLKNAGITKPDKQMLIDNASATTLYNVFSFHNDMMAKKYEDAFATLDKIAKDRSELIRFTGLMVSKFSPIYMARACLDAGWSESRIVAELMEKAKVKQYPAKLAIGDAKRFTRNTLQNATKKLGELDAYLKTGTGYVLYKPLFLEVYAVG